MFQSSFSGEFSARPPRAPAAELADREDVLVLLQFLPAPTLLAPPVSRSLCASLPSLHLPDGGPAAAAPGKLPPLGRRLLPARQTRGSSGELWRPARTGGRRRDRLLVPTYRVSDLSVISPGVSVSPPPPPPPSRSEVTRERPCAVQEGLRALESTSLSDRFPVTYRIQIRPKPPTAAAAPNGRL